MVAGAGHLCPGINNVSVGLSVGSAEGIIHNGLFAGASGIPVQPSVAGANAAMGKINRWSYAGLYSDFCLRSCFIVGCCIYLSDGEAPNGRGPAVPCEGV